MKISNLIPCYNGEKSIGGVLTQVQQIKPPERSEVIVAHAMIEHISLSDTLHPFDYSFPHRHRHKGDLYD